jgi:hypothetical protein
MTARAYRNEFTEWTIEYRDGDRVCRTIWDPRETDVYLPLAHMWSEPFEPMSRESLEAMIEAIWPVARETCGIAALMEQFRDWSFVARRWTRPDDGFLVNALDSRNLDYMELGRTALLRWRDNESYTTRIVSLPANPTWHHPSGTPITPDERARIRERIAQLRWDKDLWLGGARSYAYAVEDVD